MKRLLFTLILCPLFLFPLKSSSKGNPESARRFDKSSYQNLTPPEYPGGEKAFGNFLRKNLKWPDQVDGQGTVILSFYVEKDGNLTGFKVVKSAGKDFDKEALRVMRKSPKWIPAFKNTKPIKSKYSVPIRFFLSEKTQNA